MIVDPSAIAVTEPVPKPSPRSDSTTATTPSS
jgi:hypothetical protein